MKSNSAAKIQGHISQGPQCALQICATNSLHAPFLVPKNLYIQNSESEMSFLCSVAPIQQKHICACLNLSGLIGV